MKHVVEHSVRFFFLIENKSPRTDYSRQTVITPSKRKVVIRVQTDPTPASLRQSMTHSLTIVWRTMHGKITISESVGITGVSESTIRRDIKSGKVSSEKDEKGHRQIDTAELHRVYGMTPPQESQMAEHDSQRVVTVLENQIADLQNNSKKQRCEKLHSLTRNRNSWISCLRRKKKSAHSCHRQMKRDRNLQTGCSGTCSVRDSPKTTGIILAPLRYYSNQFWAAPPRIGAHSDSATLPPW